MSPGNQTQTVTQQRRDPTDHGAEQRRDGTGHNDAECEPDHDLPKHDQLPPLQQLGTLFEGGDRGRMLSPHDELQRERPAGQL